MTEEILTAETDEGRRAIEAVMQHSYTADIDCVPPRWARALVVDGVPVSFIAVDPNREMDFPRGTIRFAFVNDVATREDRRGEGHFRVILEDTFSALVQDGIPLVLLHGEYDLYPRFGFDVFTHHRGIFATPQLIKHALGAEIPSGGEELLVIDDSKHVQNDLLLVSDVKADNPGEARNALLVASRAASDRGKARILFEHPAAPSYGSRYPIHGTLETPFTVLARTCGAEIRLQGANPAGGSVQHADWIKVLDPVHFLKQALECVEKPGETLPQVAVRFETEAGVASVMSVGDDLEATEDAPANGTKVKWPSSAIAQLVTGYRSADILSAIHSTPLSTEAIAFLDLLFPRTWRFSRNESWTY